MRGFKAQFQVIGFLHRVEVKLSIEKEIHALQTHAQHRQENVPCVLHSVDVANLSPVVGRDRQLGDAQFLENELNDYLGVEMKVVRVLFKRYLGKGSSRVEPI